MKIIRRIAMKAYRTKVKLNKLKKIVDIPDDIVSPTRIYSLKLVTRNISDSKKFIRRGI